MTYQTDTTPLCKTTRDLNFSPLYLSPFLNDLPLPLLNTISISLSLSLPLFQLFLASFLLQQLTL